MDHHHCKRRRIQRTHGHSHPHIGGHHSNSCEQESLSGRPEEEEKHIVSGSVILPDVTSTAQETIASVSESSPPFNPIDGRQEESMKLELRQLTPNLASQANNAVQSVASSVSLAAGNAVNAANGVASNTFGSATNLAANPGSQNTPTTAAGSQQGASHTADPSPGYTEPPPAVAAADARNQALHAEEKMALQDSSLPRPPASTAIGSNHPAASQNAMSIQLVGSSSQEILSSPHTPLPSSPEASQRPSTTSYFSSNPTRASGVASQSAEASIPIASAPTAVPPGHSTGNSTSSSMTMTGSLGSMSTVSSASVASSSLGSSSAGSQSSAMDSVATISSQSDSAILGTSSGNPSDISSTLSSAMTTMTTISSSSLSSQSSSSFSHTAASSGVAGGAGGPGNSAATPSATSGSGSGSKSGGGMPHEAQALVGGIVGGVAGIVLILIAILFLIRYRKRKQGGQRRIISPPIPQASGLGASGDRGRTGTSGTMTQRSSTAPIAAAGFLSRFRPSSSQTATTAETSPSERGFQNYGGRKLESVLKSGGDGYGDDVHAGPSSGLPAGAAIGGPYPAGTHGRNVGPGPGQSAGFAPGMRPSPSHSLSGSSFYQDSNGFYGGIAPGSSNEAAERSSSPTSSSPTYPSPLAVAGGASMTPGRKPTMREGPARTPIITQVGRPSPRPSPHPERSMPLPVSNNPRDLIGRSLPSQDGSRTSRFRESTTPP